MLALVCITRAENFRKKSLINYNIGCLKKALQALVLPVDRPVNDDVQRVAE
jgi:Ras-related GTP-binding protein C/D